MYVAVPIRSFLDGRLLLVVPMRGVNSMERVTPPKISMTQKSSVKVLEPDFALA